MICVFLGYLLPCHLSSRHGTGARDIHLKGRGDANSESYSHITPMLICNAE